MGLKCCKGGKSSEVKVTGLSDEKLLRLYKRNGPSIKGGLVTKCFKRGLLFQVILGDLWAFYNDTVDFEMRVIVSCDAKSSVEPLGHTSVKERGDRKVFKTVVYPGETERVFSGAVSGVNVDVKACVLSEKYMQGVEDESRKEIRKVMRALKDYGTTSEDLAAAAVRKEIPFIDPEFAPCRASLYRKGIDERDVPALMWLRFDATLPEALHERICVMGEGGVEPSEVVQGCLQDTWFTCAVAAVTEFPQLIERLFYPERAEEELDEQQMGCFRVRLNIGGWWQRVIVDDYFPSMNNRLVFARSAKKTAMWVSLLQKAYARCHGSYASISAGDVLLAMEDLTGFFSCRFDAEWDDACEDTRSADAFLERLAAWTEGQFLVVLNTPCRGSGGAKGGFLTPASRRRSDRAGEEAELSPGCAYVVLDVKRFPRDRNLTLLRIRNPFADSDAGWTGDWSDMSRLWDDHPHIRKEIRKLGEEDHAFWMCWEDVIKHFDGGGVLLNHLSWNDYRVRAPLLSSGLPSFAVEISVTGRTRVSLGLAQEPEQNPANYSPLMLTLTGARSEGVQEVQAIATRNPVLPGTEFVYTRARNIAMEVELLPQNSPFLLIPRTLPGALKQENGGTAAVGGGTGGKMEETATGSEGKQLTISIISERAVTANPETGGTGRKGSINCVFKKLSNDCGILDDEPVFRYDAGSEDTVRCKFQYWKKSTGLVITSSGYALDAR